MEFMKQKFVFEATHVPYRSSPQTINDVVGGHIAASFAEMGASLPLLLTGKLKPLAVTSLTRLNALPDVPTLAEALNQPGYEAARGALLNAAQILGRARSRSRRKAPKRATGSRKHRFRRPRG